jgi:hypothetical protein
MSRRWMRGLAGCLVAIAGLIWLTPWGLYELGLRNITGRPVPPSSSSFSEQDELLLRKLIRAESQISVEPTSPWDYVIAFSSADPRAVSDGTKAASLVARSYNLSHLKRQQTMWWHLSGAALTIWITRHWTSDDVLRAAAAIAAEEANSRKLRDRQP